MGNSGTQSNTRYNGAGVLSGGKRLVRKGGIVKFDSAYFQDEKLVPWVGQYVSVSATDPWFNHTVMVTTLPLTPHEIICAAASLIDPTTGEKISKHDPDAAVKSMKRRTHPPGLEPGSTD